MHGLSQAEALTFRRDASRLALTWMILLAPAQSATRVAVGAKLDAPLIVGHEATNSRDSKVDVFGGGAAAVVELAPKEASWKRDYQILAHVLGLRFQRLFGTMNGCLPQPPIRVRWQQRLAAFNRWLTCNLTIDVAEVVRTAKAMEAGCVDKCDQGSRLWGRG